MRNQTIWLFPHTLEETAQQSEIQIFMAMNDRNQNIPGSMHKDNNSSRKFTIYHQNITRISSKFDGFQVSLYHNKPQVICLTEHHLKLEEITNIYLDQYKVGTFHSR